ncbi:hypothetical protein [Cylindrospermopsis raciborskii]|nr:hypothetical protein [Cylindrospermopsis raciborskii]MCZ2207995.1 hypothetical protein [Cylindrospermopsis raciborskii PAMP2011]
MCVRLVKEERERGTDTLLRMKNVGEEREVCVLDWYREREREMHSEG